MCSGDIQLMRARLRALLVLAAACLLILFWVRAGSDRPSAWQALSSTTPEDPFPHELDVVILSDTHYLSHALYAIEGASSTIDISMYLAQAPVGAVAEISAALERAAGRGVRIRACLEGEVSPSREYGRDLAARGVEVRYENSRKRIHEKSLLLDGRRMLTGSHNWTNAALIRNRELSFLVEGPPEAFKEWRTSFDLRWEDGQRESSRGIPNGVERGRPSAALTAPVGRPAPTTDLIAVQQAVVYRGRGRIVRDADYVRASRELLARTRFSLVSALYFIAWSSITRSGPLSHIGERLATWSGSETPVVILDQMNIAEGGPMQNENSRVIERMGSWPVVAFFDSPDVTHHVKAVVGDRRYVLAGSHNWTTSSTGGFNVETSLLMDCAPLALRVAEYIDSLQGRRAAAAEDDLSREMVPMEGLITVH